MDRYDAGLLGDYGGGNVSWWQDYIRAELEKAHDFYSQALTEAHAAGVAEGEKRIKVQEIALDSARQLVREAEAKFAVAQECAHNAHDANLRFIHEAWESLGGKDSYGPGITLLDAIADCVDEFKHRMDIAEAKLATMSEACKAAEDSEDELVKKNAALTAELSTERQKAINFEGLHRQAESRIGYLEGENRKLFAETAALTAEAGRRLYWMSKAKEVLNRYHAEAKGLGDYEHRRAAEGLMGSAMDSLGMALAPSPEKAAPGLVLMADVVGEGPEFLRAFPGSKPAPSERGGNKTDDEGRKMREALEIALELHQMFTFSAHPGYPARKAGFLRESEWMEMGKKLAALGGGEEK